MLAEQHDRVDMTVLATFKDYQAFRTPKPKSAASADSLIEVADEPSPSESIGRLSRPRTTLWLTSYSTGFSHRRPRSLERLALRLLRAMGYGGRESLMEHTGKLVTQASTGSCDRTRLVLISSACRRSGTTATRPCTDLRCRSSSGPSKERRPTEASS